MAAIADIHARGRLPILVGGTGFYYRALTRGLFPGAGPRRGAARRASTRMAARRGRGAAAPDARRASTRRRRRASSRATAKRIVRALEVYFQTRPPADGALRRHARAARGLDRRRDRAAPAVGRRSTARIARRVDAAVRARHRRRGARARSRRACPTRRRPFTGLVYRQVLELLHGERDEAATRELIVRENRHYARRQLIWFRKEPNLVWIHGRANADAPDDAARMCRERLA